MELATIGLLSAIVFGLIAGDAVISANTMAVGIGLPPTVQQSGLTRQSAEEIFVTELSRIAAIPSGVPVPVPRVSSRRTVIGALAGTAQAHRPDHRVAGPVRPGADPRLRDRHPARQWAGDGEPSSRRKATRCSGCHSNGPMATRWR